MPRLGLGLAVGNINQLIPVPIIPPTPIAVFGVPNNIIVASNMEDYNYEPSNNGPYTKKSPGNNLTTSAPVFVLSGSGCGYSCINGGDTFICSPSSFVMYNGIQVSQPQSVWAYIEFSIDVYGNPNWNIINSQPDATDINNMPTFWAKNGGAGNYTGIISVCLSAESVTSYLPISTQQFYINQIKLTNHGGGVSNTSYNDALYFCQPLTAAAIDSDGTTATGKMVWRGSRMFNTANGAQLRLFVAYGKYEREYPVGFMNNGRPYWRAFFYNTAYAVKDQTMLYNFNTSAFGIPLSGWNSTVSYTDFAQFNAGNGRDNYPVFRTSLSAVTFGTPQKIIVAHNQDRDTYQNGSYTRKSTGDTLVPAPATVWKLSGSGYGYSNDLASITATDRFRGGHSFIVSPSSYIVYAETGVKTTPIGQWSYINANIDVYGNPVFTTANTQSDATDNNNMPTYWAKNGGPQDWYNGILSVCVSAESTDAYLPITTQMLSISGITLTSNSFYNDALYSCQPLTAAAIDSDGSGATGKMVWQGSRIYPNVSSSTLQLLLTFGIHKGSISGTILNAGRPYWRLAFRDTRYGASDAAYQTLMANYNTSAFGIPLSGWSLDPNNASSSPYFAGKGRSNYPILSAATTVSSRNSVNVTGSTYSEAVNQGNGVYTKTSEDTYRLGAYLEGTVYATSEFNMRIKYDMGNKYWMVLDAAGDFIYYNPYQGTRVIPQSGWKNAYVNTPSTFTVR